MKIKDVINITGLTDRAIRLYIENGLVSPKHTENYAGRKSFEFSSEDTDRLKSIAILRKAGFSIETIRKLFGDEKERRAALEDFLKHKKEEKEQIQDVLERLTPFLEADSEITAEEICNKLTAYTEMPLPEAERRLAPKEFAAKCLHSAISFTATLSCLFLLLSILKGRSEYEYPVLYKDAYIHFIKLFLIPLTAFTAFSEHRRVSYKHYEKVTAKTFVKKALALITVWAVLIFSIFIGIFPLNLFFSEYYSETESLENYLEVDDFVKTFYGDIYELFPATVADSAKILSTDGSTGEYKDTAKYYYRYRNDLGDDFDIYAQWQLPEGKAYIENIEREKAEAKKNFPELTQRREQKGDWTLIHYGEDREVHDSYYFYRIFAYNDKTNTVRYILSYDNNKPGGYESTPYFTELEW